MDARRDLFFGSMHEGRWVERASVAGESPRHQTPRVPFVIPAGARAAAIKRWAGRALKWTGRTIYLSPLLLVAQFLTSLWDGRAGAWITVTFVCLVVAFFAALNAYILVSAIAFGFAEYGRPRVRVPRRAARREAEQASLERALPGVRVRARGRVVALEATARDPLVTEEWLEQGANLVRVSETSPFAIVGDRSPPLVLSHRSAPTLVASARRTRAETGAGLSEPARRLASSFGAPTTPPIRRLEVRAGDEVEVVGRIAAPILDTSRIEVDGAIFALPDGRASGTPYRHRERRPGLLLTSTPDEPLEIVLISNAG